jgi:hypothetical protein
MSKIAKFRSPSGRRSSIAGERRAAATGVDSDGVPWSTVDVTGPTRRSFPTRGESTAKHEDRRRNVRIDGRTGGSTSDPARLRKNIYLFTVFRS